MWPRALATPVTAISTIAADADDDAAIKNKLAPITAALRAMTFMEGYRTSATKRILKRSYIGLTTRQ
jgi:hypothetical protein